MEMKFPRKIAIGFQEGVCQLRCNKCPAFGRDAKRKKEIYKMPIEKAKLLIDEIAKLEHTPIIQPCIYAEPLANPDLREIIFICNERNISMSIITNGILLDEQWLNFLIDNTNRKYTVSFSLDAVTQETYEKVRGNYRLGLVEENIEKLVRKRGDAGPRVTVNFTVEEDNEFETEEFIERWKYKVDGVRISVGVDSQRKIPLRYRHKWHEEISKKCGYIGETMVIDANGHVRSCTYDPFGDTDFGSVFERGILQIWNGEDMKKFRELQEQGRFMANDFCKGCEAGLGAMKRSRASEEFIINEADYAVYYNMKDNYNLEFLTLIGNCITE